ncbi:MAG: NifU family protein [Wenzhouxiangella sp.]|nr:NifU family protein [Wenzhouxiangella sp.]MCH8477733.1 NifU family protein [Wenzhouxiangella sp.]TVR95974.1 MAG: Fe-S biogenesis protein NfuA [Wenzhouxiangellaceae bacterium]
MLTISPAARDYFARLLEQQADGTNLRLRTIKAGTPAADVELTYCPADGQQDSDEVVDCQVFVLYVDAASAETLDGAMIDFETNAMGGELSIRAPGLKGQKPAEDAPLRQRVEWVLDARVNPMVASHGGVVGLVDVTDSGDVVLQFGGGCHGCGMADVTLKQGIETTLRQEIPELGRVIDATDHASGENPYY